MPGRKLIVMLSAPSPKKFVAEGQIGDRNFVPARWQMADHKAIGLAACDGLSIDYVVGLNRNPKSGAAVDYEARRLGGDCARENLASRRTRRCASSKESETNRCGAKFARLMH